MQLPTVAPSNTPTVGPSPAPTLLPLSAPPTDIPTILPTRAPSRHCSLHPFVCARRRLSRWLVRQAAVGDSDRSAYTHADDEPHTYTVVRRHAPSVDAAVGLPYARERPPLPPLRVAPLPATD